MENAEESKIEGVAMARTAARSQQWRSRSMTSSNEKRKESPRRITRRGIGEIVKTRRADGIIVRHVRTQEEVADDSNKGHR